MRETVKLAGVRPGAIAFWMLNDASTTAEKIDYLRRCRAGGIEAVAMHPRSGNLMPYGSRDWYAMIAALVEEGRRLNMAMWLYDEDPYPSGAAGGMVMATRPDLQARYMVRHVCPDTLKPGDLWCISQDPIVWAGLTPRQGNRPAHDLTASVGMVRRDWFMTPWDSRYYYDLDQPVACPRGDAVRQWYAMRLPVIPKGYALVAISAAFAGVEGSWGSLPDLLHPDSFPCFRDLSLEPYRRVVGAHFGSTIPGIFTDEAKPHGGLPLTADLWEAFRQRFGVDLRSNVWQLFGPARDDAGDALRLNYRRWVNERFLDVFVRPYRRYCDRLGLRLIGHFSPEDDPLAEARSGISVMSIMQEMSGPGTDLIVPRTGSRPNATLNLGSLRAASVRAQQATGICMSESLGLSGWDVTTQTCRRILAWQTALGIDRFFLHGFFTSSEGVQNYEAPPEFGPGSSIFAGISVLNEWLKRIEDRMTGAKEAAPVAVLNSMPTFWSASADTESPEIETARQSLWQSVQRLLEAHVGIHLVDEARLSAARCNRDGFVIGARRYGWVLAPAVSIIEESTLQCLSRAAAKGVRVYWFGGGPRRCLGRDHRLNPCPPLPGEVLSVRSPSPAWCRRQLPQQADVKGAGAEHVFLRRFQARDGHDYLLAANIIEQPADLCLAPENGRVWQPLDVDGNPHTSGGDLRWQVPSGGCGLFRLTRKSGEAVPMRQPFVRPLSLKGIRFRRSGPNLARLTSMTVVRPDRQPTLTVPFPKPYWQLFDDYRTGQVYPSYAGAVPVESHTAIDHMDCRFTFSVAAAGLRPVTLLLDPRCARGQFDLLLDGRPLRKTLRFPLDRIRPLRVPLKGLTPGAHQLVLRFSLQSAMDGVLSQLYLEGDVDVAVRRAGPRLEPVKPVGATPDGWQTRGLPHYMGQGIYRWTEYLALTEWREDVVWQLELDQVVDSAEVWVNGQSAGSRAWTPWRWTLPGMRPGRNRFELRVAGTAGNKHQLTWPAQPQGWIGRGRLIRTR